MEYLGPSLEQIRHHLPSNMFTKYTFLYAASKTLECIEALHSLNIIHRDIKPANFLLRNDNSICLIDFGLSSFYMINRTHIEDKFTDEIGTLVYQSPTAHEKRTLSRRDDMISWFYMLSELKNGSLPWSGNNSSRSAMMIVKTQSKDKITAKMPHCFKDIFLDIITLGFADKPKYEDYKTKIDNELSMVERTKFDWDNIDLRNLAETEEGGCCEIC